jgi:virginiamycin B lyase
MAGGAGGTPDAGQGGAGGTPVEAGSPPAAGALKVDKIFEIVGATASAPHDPAVDSKGVSWWTDQNGSRIGFWDPATDMSMTFATPTPNCGVHGLTPDDKDNIWYTGQGCGRIGRIDAVTKAVTDFVVPGGGGPHTPVFLDGIIWFTLQSGGRIGRLDIAAPDNSPTKVQTFPIGPGPYGIWISPTTKKLWVAMFPTNQIVEVDPANPGMPNRITLPNAGSRPRRIAVDKNGHVYYTDDARGFLGRYDPSPATPAGERFKEWAAPGGGAPYAITVGPDDRIYYGFGGRNVIAVFDPAKPDQPQQVINIGVPLTANRHMTTDLVRRRVWLGLSGARRMAYIQVP